MQSGFVLLSVLEEYNLAWLFEAGRERTVAAGEVIVTESGSVQPLMRRPRPPAPPGAQVNQLVLVNNSKRPLILLAGEIVTGGKQDRVIGKDRIIPGESDPIDLAVSLN